MRTSPALCIVLLRCPPEGLFAGTSLAGSSVSDLKIQELPVGLGRNRITIGLIPGKKIFAIRDGQRGQSFLFNPPVWF
jgi:hypothetical protein